MDKLYTLFRREVNIDSYEQIINNFMNNVEQLIEEDGKTLKHTKALSVYQIALLVNGE